MRRARRTSPTDNPNRSRLDAFTGGSILAQSTRVLLVDCFSDEREMYEEYLRFTGFDPVDVCEPANAFKTATTVRPDVIVTDMVLRRTLDGLELIRQLRDDSRTAKTLIIVISGFVFPRHRAKAEAAGCDIFLPKPCLPQTLVEAIRSKLPSPPRRMVG